MGVTAKKNESLVQVLLDDIRIDGGTQPRVEVNQQTVDEYAEKLDTLPPPDVFFDGANYWLADGFHRYHAHRKKKRGVINCRKHIGTVRDAILFAIVANSENPLQLTSQDRRHICRMLLSDEEWGKWSNEEIARQCKVSPWLVADEKRLWKEDVREKKEREKAAAERAAEKARQEADAKAKADRDKIKEGWVLPGKKAEPAPQGTAHLCGDTEIAEDESAEEEEVVCHRNGATYTLKTGKIGKGRDRNVVRTEHDPDKLRELDEQIKRSRRKYIRQCLKRGMTRKEILADVEREIDETPVAILPLSGLE